MSYTVIEELGKGGYGVVYKVTDEQEREFTQKVFNSARLVPEAIPDIKKRFEREVKYQSFIDHLNVVRIRKYHVGRVVPPWYNS